MINIIKYVIPVILTLILSCDNEIKTIELTFENIGFEGYSIEALNVGIMDDIIVATKNDCTFYTSFLHKTTDNGISWDTIAQTPGSIKNISTNSLGYIFTTGLNGLRFNLNIWQFVFLSISYEIFIDNDDNVYVTTASGLMFSNNDGDSWIEIGGELPYSGSSKNCKIITDIYNNVYIGYGEINSTNYGVFKLDSVWVFDGLNDYSIQSLIADKEGSVYALTRSGDIFEKNNPNSDWEVIYHIPINNADNIVIDADNNLCVTNYNSVFVCKDDEGECFRILKMNSMYNHIKQIDVTRMGELLIGTMDGLLLSPIPIKDILKENEL